ncbi:small subunit ribosomal protein S20 [Haloferula luteola]|uniref:Small ribosomal subunit protein bS20 n=1 Tax=Haloferula luteola TaxID=595692 RepID=A0A840V1W5_9BACT|nr:30S ribosomal protein S20 [Haloferula luteola]MBB5351046.1 small subunit ribosomal protein S20 [Haloferula luteola]
MANHKSALKRVRQTKIRTERNRDRKSTIKKLRKEALSAVASGDASTAASAASKLSSAVDKAAKKGLIHANKAANIKSKTAKALASIA